MIALPTIRQGDRGVLVDRLQAALALRVDGEFGGVTDAAVRSYQRAAGLVVDGIVGPRTWARLLARDVWPPTAPAGGSAGDALVAVALACLGVAEGPVSNRGDRVDDILRWGGFRVPGSARTPGPPWCAWLVSACSSIAADSLHEIWRPTLAKRGRASAYWVDAPADRRIPREAAWSDLQPGDVFVRSRVSGPVSDREAIVGGRYRDGHIGPVEWVDRAARVVHCVAGNSSGHGHAKTSGAVAREAIREGDAAWDRVAGWVRIAGEV